MTTLQKKGEQPLTPDSLISIMLKNANGWDQVAAFVASGAAKAANSHHPMPDLAISPPPRVCH